MCFAAAAVPATTPISVVVLGRYGIAGKTIALCSEDREKEVAFEANEVNVNGEQPRFVR